MEEIPKAIQRLNERSPNAEQIIGMAAYEEFRYKDKKLPPLGTLRHWYKKEHGNEKGLMEFILNRIQIESYTLEETPEAVRKLNEKSPDAEQITSIGTYEKFRYKDEKLPPWNTLASRYKKARGSRRGLSDFIFSKPQKTMKAQTSPAL